MVYGDNLGPFDTAGIIRREREERERKAVAKAARIDAELEQIMPAVERGDVEAMQKAMALLGDKHDFTIETRTSMPSGAAAFAQWNRRNIVVPAIVDAETFATNLHEAGHIIAGECSGREPHQPDPTVTRWHHCLACETRAWEIAMRLVPFSREMHEDLRRSLQTYRRSTPGPATAVRQLDELASTVGFRLDQHRRRKWKWRLEQLARAKASLGGQRT